MQMDVAIYVRDYASLGKERLYYVRYRPGVHEACLAQFVRVVSGGLRTQDSAHCAPFARTLTDAAIALHPNQSSSFTICLMNNGPASSDSIYRTQNS